MNFPCIIANIMKYMLEIIIYPNPILTQKSQEITEITPDVLDLAKEMQKMVEIDENSVGLAAPQIGKNIRICVIQPNKEEPGMALFNPKIIKKSFKKEIMEEGCLSIPEKYLPVKRAFAVKVEALDKTGKKIKLSLKGWPARVVQHEIDHLDGILFIDRAENE